MVKFYTGTGDEGYTGLLGEGTVPKYDPRTEAVGSIDEASAALGVARSVCLSATSAALLLSVQRDLYHIMAEVASTVENAARFRSISAERVSWLEKQIDSLSAHITLPKEFIVPGDTAAGAALDLARTIVRRAERRVVYLTHQELLENKELIRYLNRLSSLCFVLEIVENQAAGKEKPTLAKDSN